MLQDNLMCITLHVTGAKTGRSPRDKRVVREAESENDIWWNQDKNGSPNFEMDERWDMLQQILTCFKL